MNECNSLIVEMLIDPRNMLEKLGLSCICVQLADVYILHNSQPKGSALCKTKGVWKL